MKTECAANVFSRCTTYEPGRIDETAAAGIERFRFPPSEYPLEPLRRKEIEIDRSYDSRSVYIVYYSRADGRSILATARIILKTGRGEKLPIEHGSVTAVTDGDSPPPVDRLKIGEPVVIAGDAATLPACEIGGLRAADADRSRGITIRDRYLALQAVLNNCFDQCIARRIRTVFLTCAGTPNVLGIYRDRYLFREFAEISYGSGPRWKALWRYVPEKAPERKIRQSK